MIKSIKHTSNYDTDVYGLCWFIGWFFEFLHIKIYVYKKWIVVVSINMLRTVV